MNDYRLPKPFAEEWLKALRSGKFKQTKHKLFRAPGYCCLGVACKISGMDDIDLSHKVDGFVLEFPAELKETLPSDFPKELSNGFLPEKVASLNDNEGMSFAQIADWIEENVEFYT